MHKYKLKYDLDTTVGSFSADELVKSGKGGTDAYIFASIIYPDGGGVSVQIKSLDGRKGLKNESPQPMDANDIFVAWIMMGNSLSKSKSLDELKRSFCEHAVETFFKTIEKK